MSQKAKLKSVWSLIKNYKWQSIFFSYLKNMLFVLLIPTMILTIGVFLFLQLVEHEGAAIDKSTVYIKNKRLS